MSGFSPRIATIDQRGVAMLEMMVIVPLLFFLVIGGLEYSRILERSQWISQLSREVANVSYRSCAVSRGNVLNSCLKRNVLTPLTSQASLLAPDTEFVIGVFSYTAGAVREEGVEGSQAYLAKFRSGGFTPQVLQQQADARTVGSPGNAVRETGLIIVAVAFSPTQSTAQRIIPGLKLFFPT